MAKPLGKTFVEIDIDAKKYNKGVVDVKTTTKKKLTEIEKAWKGLGKKSEKTYDDMRAAVNKNYEKIKRHASSTADDIFRAEKAKNDKITRINKQQFGQQKSLLDKIKKHWMLLSAAAIAAVYAIQRVLKKSITEYADFETALVDMGKVTSESFDSIKKKIRELPPELGTATELVKGYYQVISAGVTEPKAAIDMLTEASQLAKAAHIEVDEAIKGLTKVMAGYEGELKTTADAADLLYTIEKEGQTSVAELIPIIGGLAKISKDLGVESDEMGAALATVTLTAGTTSEAATRYEAVLIALMKPTKAMKKAVSEMGYESAQLAIKDLGLVEVLKKLKDSAGGSANKLAELFGRKEALVGISALASENFETLTGKIDAMADKTGAADKAWEDYKTTLNAILDTFNNIVTNQFIRIGEVLAPQIKKVVEKTGEWLEKNQKIITQNIATVIDAIATAAGALAKVYGALAGAQKTVAEQVNKLSKEQQESIKLMLEQQTGLAGAKTVFKLFADAYVYWLGQFTKEEEKWIITIGRREKAQDEASKATIGGLKEEEEMIKSRLAGEKKLSDEIKKAAAKEAKLFEDIAIIRSDYWIDQKKESEDALKDWIKRNNEEVKASKEAAKDKAEAARDLYKDLKGFEDQYYKYSDALIEAQAQRYRDLGLEEAAIAAWVAQEHMKAAQDKIEASNTWQRHTIDALDDVKAAHKEMVNDMVASYIQGESDKRTAAEISGEFMVNIAGRTATRALDAAIDQAIDMIGIYIGQGAAGVAAWAAPKGGVGAVLGSIGTFLAIGVGAMLAGRAMG